LNRKKVRPKPKKKATSIFDLIQNNLYKIKCLCIIYKFIKIIYAKTTYKNTIFVSENVSNEP